LSNTLKQMALLKKKQTISNYTVQFHIKQGEYAETYRVKDNSGKNYFLKIFNLAKLHRTQFNSNNSVLELEIAKLLDHPNLCKYHDSAEITLENQKLVFIVYDFISGETVAQRIIRDQTCSVFDAKQILIGVLNGLKFLHNQPNPIIHNDLTTQNVMLDLSGDAPISKIIDFGYARFQDQDMRSFRKDGLNPFYMAPECFNGVFSIQSDLFSVGAMLYHLLFGLPPSFIDLSKYQSKNEALEDVILEERLKPLKLPNLDIFELDEQLINILHKALSNNIDLRFKSADEFIKALKGELSISKNDTCNFELSEIAKGNIPAKQRTKGNGFADIAGMEELKEQLRFDVINLLTNPEEYKKHKLELPNGILLYGPPGCGKTFFAEKFADETGYNFQKVVSSDIASIYVHGTQEKIREIFDAAKANAPTILYFDEINSMVPKRDSNNLQNGAAGEVNEFLSQLDNCGSFGVFVVASTNYPTHIDTAVLRAGRLEQKFYVSPPDFEARKAMFEMYLKGRPMDFGIDYNKLAQMTDSFVSADIKLLIDKTSRKTIREKLGVITMETLEKIITTSEPTVTIDEIRKHELIRDEFEGQKRISERKNVGY